MSEPYEISGQSNWGSPQLAKSLADAVSRAIDKKSPGGESSDIPIAMIRYAKVTAVSPLAISLGADPTPQAAIALSWYVPTVDDIVAVIQPTQGPPIVLGKTVVVADTAWRVVGAGGQPAFGAAYAAIANVQFSKPRFRKDSNGFVHLQGYVVPSGATMGSGTIFTLPVGYRPLLQEVFSTWAFSGGAYNVSRVDVLASGAVALQAPTAGVTDLPLAGITFFAEQ